MNTFILTLDLTGHEHPENPVAQRQFVQQRLLEAAQQIGSGHVDSRVKSGAHGVAKDHPSTVHAQGQISYRQKVVGAWEFLEADGQ